MSSEKIYEMLWDCEFCGSKKLLGKTHRHCPNCGAAQDPTRRYFPSESEKVAVVDHIYYGADRVCPFCQTPNSANAKFCGNCGGDLDGAKEVTRRSDQIVGQANDSVQAAKTDFEQQKSQNAEEKQDLAFPDSKWIKPHAKTPTWVKWTLLSTLVGGIGFFLLGVLWTEVVSLQVSQQNWERTIEIERFKPVSDSSWCDSMPMDAYSVSRRSEVRSYRQVADGEECHTVRSDRGDGTYSESESCSTKYRSEPEYDDKCYFTVDRWTFERNSKSSGDGIDPEPFWPSPTFNDCGQSIGCERLGQRKEVYTVHFIESSGETRGEKHDCEFEQTKWKHFVPGKEYKAEKSVIFNYITCDTLTSIEPPTSE
ncbi:hypothetical protein LPTSP4_27160 [Leptospira ryugenii]|uniref:Uncharacterized protein n=1 Tax=Leptospira ryugenii TaxID=1917863 RepID=A0A2P2E2V4_9LEPT|nr:zinc ribbon domain-containing protein [Leptospira ryugenii]GBF51184.1 hypothetical protein LPTSP4_27160 [Leptospira ryugenii]